MRPELKAVSVSVFRMTNLDKSTKLIQNSFSLTQDIICYRNSKCKEAFFLRKTSFTESTRLMFPNYVVSWIGITEKFRFLIAALRVIEKNEFSSNNKKFDAKYLGAKLPPLDQDVLETNTRL